MAVDVRPADMRLYSLTDTGRIDPATGEVQMASTLDTLAGVGGRVATIFNLAVDRLRVVGMNGASHRVTVDTGAVDDGTFR